MDKQQAERMRQAREALWQALSNLRQVEQSLTSLAGILGALVEADPVLAKERRARRASAQSPPIAPVPPVPPAYKKVVYPPAKAKAKR